MYFKRIGPGRYRVQLDKDDTQFWGVVERHCFRRMDQGGREEVFFLGRAIDRGWKETKGGKFTTRPAAGEFVLAQAGIAYGDRRMGWKVKADAR